MNAKTRPEAQTPLQIARRLAADFAENAAERDVAGGTPKAERDALRRSGLLSLIIPREYGGLGASWSETLQTVRELARVDSSIAHVYGFQHLMLATVRLFSRPEQWQPWFELTARNRWFWGNALNPLDNRTVARRFDGWREFSGKKSFCSGARDSEMLIASALDGEGGPLLIAAIPTARSGISLGQDWDNMGQRQTDSGSAIFERVRVEESELLLDPGPLSTPFACLRPLIAQLIFTEVFLGIAEGAFEEARQYTLREARPWFRSEVAEANADPYVLARYGEFWVGLESTRALVERAAQRLDAAWSKGPALDASERGQLALAIAAAKVAATRNGLDLCNRMFEVTGARSTHAALRLDRYWRNLRTQTLHDPLAGRLGAEPVTAATDLLLMNASTHTPDRLLTLPRSPNLATSIRATAQVFEDPKSQALLEHLRQVAPSEASVLVIGETGTGKELVARHIHNLSARRNGPFVAVNCGAFSESLVEAELFGHEKGAFTGALAAKAGWFEEANGGTLFLDEIGDLPMPIQVKLLRVLQEREVVRLGSRKSIPIDVRVLAATNVQLERAINAGHFREDLYYRLNVVSLELSPLRERPGDILPLTRHFIAEYSRRLGYGQSQLSPEAAQKLRAYSWPGNIRELENVIHHTLLICRDGLIRADDLHLSNLRLERGEELARGGPASGAAEHLLQQAFQRLFEEQGENLHGRVEDALLRAAYRFCHGNQVHTANLLGLSRNVTRTRLIAIGELVVNKRGGQRIDGERAVRLSI